MAFLMTMIFIGQSEKMKDILYLVISILALIVFLALSSITLVHYLMEGAACISMVFVAFFASDFLDVRDQRS